MVRVHVVAGKERGVMVIGTASELGKMATALVAGLDGKPENSTSSFPELVAEYLPVQDLDQGVSFHLETQPGDQPRKVFGDTELGRTVFLLLAIIGLVSIVRWVLSHAL